MNKRDKKHARKQQDQQNVGRGAEIKIETKTSQQASDQEDNAVEKTEAKRKDSVTKQSLAKTTKNKDIKAMPEQQLSQPEKELFPVEQAAEDPPKPTMLEQIDKIDGACEYFYIL